MYGLAKEKLSRRNGFFSVTGSEKYWSGLNTFSVQMCMSLRVCHFTDPVSNGTNIKCLLKDFGECCTCELLYFLFPS